VAIHAGRGRRNVRVPGFLDPVVTIPAINPQLIGVDGVRKSHRLNRLITNACVFRGEIVPNASRNRTPYQKSPDNDLARELVRPLWKYIRH